jgi:hypothetical protein
VDPSKNTVVNFSDTSHYDLNDSVPSITINKSDDTNVYPVRMVPLYGGVQVTRTDETEVDTDFYRRGIDVVLVLDESGSMDWVGPDGNRKLDSMVNASKLFVGFLNSSIDRVGAVGYTDFGIYHLVDNDYYIANDFDRMNTTLETKVEDRSGTHVNRGLYKMLTIYDLTSDFNRDQYALLLTDGKNDNSGLNEDTIDRAKQAAANDIQIYTVGFGDSSYLNETLLKEVASISDGEYHYAKNRSELQEVFSDIAQSIASRKKVVHDPASMELGTGGNLFGPQIPGSSDYVANYSDLLNINDPTTPANFSFTFSMDDGEPLNLTAYQYECKEWELTGDVKVNETTGDQYYVTRCAKINNSEPPDTITGSAIHVYTDDNSTADVKDDFGETRWFQTNLSEVLEPYNESGELDLKSNQAIVGVNYSDGRRMLLLLEIGRSQETNDLTYIVDVTIDDVEVEEKDEQGG